MDALLEVEIPEVELPLLRSPGTYIESTLQNSYVYFYSSRPRARYPRSSKAHIHGIGWETAFIRSDYVSQKGRRGRIVVIA